MKRKDYIEPTCSLVYMLDDLMEETLPLAGSPDFTDSGDDSGGGLSKKDFTGTVMAMPMAAISGATIKPHKPNSPRNPLCPCTKRVS